MIKLKNDERNHIQWVTWKLNVKISRICSRYREQINPNFLFLDPIRLYYGIYWFS